MLAAATAVAHRCPADAGRSVRIFEPGSVLERSRSTVAAGAESVLLRSQLLERTLGERSCINPALRHRAGSLSLDPGTEPFGAAISGRRTSIDEFRWAMGGGGRRGSFGSSGVVVPGSARRPSGSDAGEGDGADSAPPPAQHGLVLQVAPSTSRTLMTVCVATVDVPLILGTKDPATGLVRCSELPAPTEDLLRLRLAWGYCMTEMRRSHRYACVGLTSSDDVNTLRSSLGCLSGRGWFRRRCIRLVDHPAFNTCVLVAILLNTVALFISSDSRWVNNSELQRAMWVVETVFFIFFTYEMLLRIAARGFVMHRAAYMRNPWNVLDFVIVVAMFASVLGIGGNLTVLRTLRALRPLRTVSRVSGLRLVVVTFFRSIPRMLDALALLAFVVWLFAIVGVMLFRGALRYQCHVPAGTLLPTHCDGCEPHNDLTMAAGRTDGLCGDPLAVFGTASYANGSQLPQALTRSDAVQLLLGHSVILARPWPACNDSNVCGSSALGRCCAPGLDCLEREGSAPPRGQLGFDHILEAAVAVLKLASLDDWPQDLETHQQRFGHHIWVFFIAAAVIGNFFVFNVALAVIATEMEARMAVNEDNAPPPPPRPGLTTAQAAGAAQVLPALAVMVHMCCAPSESEVAAYLLELSRAGNPVLRQGSSSDRFPGREFTGETLCNMLTAYRMCGTDRTGTHPEEVQEPRADDLGAAYSEHGAPPFAEDSPMRQPAHSPAPAPLLPDTQEVRFDLVSTAPSQVPPNGLSGAAAAAEEAGDATSPTRPPPHLASGTLRATSPRMVRFGHSFPAPARSHTDAGLALLARDASRMSLANPTFTRAPSSPRALGASTRASDAAAPSLSGSTPSCGMPEEELGAGRKRLLEVVRSNYFRVLCLGVTAFNVLVLAMDTYPQSSGMEMFIDTAGFACSIFFIAEAAFKLAVLHCSYFHCPYNVFDFILVLLSAPDLAGVGGSLAGSNALRALRAVRVLRLIRGTSRLRRILNTLVISLREAVWLMLVIMLLLVVAGVLGMQLYPNPFSPNDSPRLRFSSWWEALLSVFIFAVTGEGWGTALAHVVRRDSWASSWLYFVVCFLIGNALLLNGFVAIVSTNFWQQGRDCDPQEDEERQREAQEQAQQAVSNQARRVSIAPVALETDHWRSGLHEAHDGAERQSDRDGCSVDLGPVGFEDEATETDPRPEARQLPSYLSLFRARSRHGLCRRLRRFWTKSDDRALEGDALGCIPPESDIRQLLGRVVLHSAYCSVVNLLIVVNAAMIAMDTPDVRTSSPGLHKVLEVSDFIFAILFTVECMLNIVAFGFYPESETAYLRDDWNKIDLVVAIVALGSTALDFLRPFRAVRTVRLIVRLGGPRRMALMVMGTLREVGDTVLLLLSFMVVWAILGVQLFKGTFNLCNDPTVIEKAQCTGWYNASSVTQYGVVRQPAQRDWVPSRRQTFDNIGEALLSLFVVLIGDGWASIMWAAVDVRGYEQSTDFNRQPWNAIYFVIFIVIAQFVTVNIFVSVLIDAVLRRRRQQHDEVVMGHMKAKMSEEHFVHARVCAFEWLQGEKRLREQRPPPLQTRPADAVRSLCYSIATGDWGPLRMRLTAESALRSRRSAHARKLRYEQRPAETESSVWSDSEARFVDLPDSLRGASYMYGPSSVRFGTLFTVELSRPARVVVLCDAESAEAQEQHCATRQATENGFIEALIEDGWREDLAGVYHAMPHSQEVTRMRCLSTTAGTRFGGLPPQVRLPMTEAERTLMCVVAVPVPQRNTFELCITLVIVLNVIVLSFTHAGETDRWIRARTVANYIFVAIYVLECIIKVLGLGWSGYWYSTMNRFDFAIVCVSLLRFAVAFPGGVAVLRLFRVARLIRLIRTARGLNMMITTLTTSLPQLGNVSWVLCIVVFIFAAIGVDLFGHVQTSQGMSEFSNFKTVYHAYVTLMQVTTTEGWADIMHTLISAGVSQWSCRIYFMTFLIMCGILLVNVFVAVVVESYQEAMVQVSAAQYLDGHFAPFIARWQEADRHGAGYLPADTVLGLLRQEARAGGAAWSYNLVELWAYQQSRGCLGATEFQLMLRGLAPLCVPVTREGRVPFGDLVALLALRLYQLPLWVAADLTRRGRNPLRSDWWSLHHHHALRKLQRWQRRGRMVVRFAPVPMLWLPGVFRRELHAERRRHTVYAAARAARGDAEGSDGGGPGPRDAQGEPLRELNRLGLMEVDSEVSASSAPPPQDPRAAGGEPFEPPGSSVPTLPSTASGCGGTPASRCEGQGSPFMPPQAASDTPSEFWSGDESHEEEEPAAPTFAVIGVNPFEAESSGSGDGGAASALLSHGANVGRNGAGSSEAGGVMPAPRPLPQVADLLRRAPPPPAELEPAVECGGREAPAELLADGCLLPLSAAPAGAPRRPSSVSTDAPAPRHPGDAEGAAESPELLCVGAEPSAPPCSHPGDPAPPPAPPAASGAAAPTPAPHANGSLGPGELSGGGSYGTASAGEAA